MPKTRSDRDSSRRIYPELANQIQEIRSKYPKIAATTLLEMLITKGVIAKNEMPAATMQRFFKKNPIM